MKRTILILILVALAIAPAALAQDATAAGVSEAVQGNWLLSLIPVAAPVVVGLIRWLWPKVPKAALPVLAPIVGAGLDLVLHFSTGAAPNTVAAALLGLAGVGLREMADQTKKAVTAPAN